jgi:hypothetical protein
MTSNANIISIMMSMKCLEEGGKHGASFGRKEKEGWVSHIEIMSTLLFRLMHSVKKLGSIIAGLADRKLALRFCIINELTFSSTKPPAQLNR